MTFGPTAREQFPLSFAVLLHSTPLHREHTLQKTLVPAATLPATAMDTGVPAFPMSPVMTEMFRQLFFDPDQVEGFLAHLLSYTHCALPEPPMMAGARLFALLPEDSVDHFSRLPGALLSNAVSCLPVKDVVFRKRPLLTMQPR